MAEKEKITEGAYTEFGFSTGTSYAMFMPFGNLSKWFSHFYATKAAPYIAQQAAPGPTALHPLAGDAVKHSEVIKGVTNPAYGISINYPNIPQYELNRKKRYQEFERMDNYPEIVAAFDIYADD